MKIYTNCWSHHLTCLMPQLCFPHLPCCSEKAFSVIWLLRPTSEENIGWGESYPHKPTDNKIIQRQLNLGPCLEKFTSNPIPFHPYLYFPFHPYLSFHSSAPHCCVINSQAPAGESTFPLPRSMARTKHLLITNHYQEQGTQVFATSIMWVMCCQLLQRLCSVFVKSPLNTSYGYAQINVRFLLPRCSTIKTTEHG